MSRKLVGIEGDGGFTAKLGVGDYLPLPVLAVFPDPISGHTLLVIDGDGNLQLIRANGSTANLSLPKLSNQYPNLDSGSGGVDGRFAASRLVAGAGNFDPSNVLFAAGTPIVEDANTLAQLTAPATGKKILVLQARSGQTANPFEIQNESGGVLASGTPAGLFLGANLKSGSGSPEGSVSASVGTIYGRTDGGSGTSLYIKESGSGNTGWTAVSAAGTLGAPTIEATANAGTGATASITGDDGGGLIEVVTGSSVTGNSDLAVITLANSRASAISAVIWPANTAACGTAASRVFVTGSTTGFSINTTTLTLAGSTTYQWQYVTRLP